jgi:hypothetical protein
MPLPEIAIDRTLLHTRTITCEGYERADGLWDIDGWGLRMTIDRDLIIRNIVAVQDFTPFSLCPAITPSFTQLIGLSLGKGFRRAVREKVGGIRGCVHLVDLLAPMATVAYQTLDEPLYRAAQKAGGRPYFINACHAWDETGALTAREFPGALKAGA